MRRNYAVTVPNVNRCKKGGKRRLLGACLTNFLTRAKACFRFSLATSDCQGVYLSGGSQMKAFHTHLPRCSQHFLRQLFLPLFLLFSLAGCSQDDSKKNTPPPAPVRVESVSRADVPRLLHAVGNVRASSSVGVKPRGLFRVFRG